MLCVCFFLLLFLSFLLSPPPPPLLAGGSTPKADFFFLFKIHGPTSIKVTRGSTLVRETIYIGISMDMDAEFETFSSGLMILLLKYQMSFNEPD